MIKYKAMAGTITTEEVESETEKTVRIHGQNVKKHSATASYFDTWIGAHKHEIARANRNVNAARARLTEREVMRSRVMALKPVKGVG